MSKVVGKRNCHALERRFSSPIIERVSSIQFSSADTFEAFLSNDKRGHCEYFATASVLMLRSLGIASRIVLGYRGGVYNEVADLFEVKKRTHMHG
ncbi:MAG: transglutaminase-like domain-containing protein [Bdellovibrionota bacterium]